MKATKANTNKITERAISLKCPHCGCAYAVERIEITDGKREKFTWCQDCGEDI
jgi:transposase-like protein